MSSSCCRHVKLTSPQTSVLRAVVSKEFVQQQDYTELRANAARFFKTRLPVLKDVWGFAEEEHGGGKATVGGTGRQGQR